MFILRSTIQQRPLNSRFNIALIFFKYIIVTFIQYLFVYQISDIEHSRINNTEIVLQQHYSNFPLFILPLLHS